MSERYEVSAAHETAVRLVRADSIDDEGDDPPDERLALVIGNPYASAYAVIGDLNQLRVFALELVKITYGAGGR